MQKILIIGGCGYIGSRLFIYLSQNNFIVDTVDLEWFGNSVNPKNIKRNYDSLPKRFFASYDVVILLAGHSTVDMCNKDMIGSLKNNIDNFVRLLPKLSKQKFIFASTYRLYSSRENHLAKETDKINNPNSIYDLTKETIEHYASFSSLEFYSLRMATVNGMSLNMRENQIINKLFLASKRKEKITIYNERAIFSVLGIDDLCRAVEKIIIGRDFRGIYNLKSFDTTLNQLSKSVSKLVSKLDISIDKPTTKSHHICIDATKFSRTYNFRFQETQEKIISTLIKKYSSKIQTIK